MKLPTLVCPYNRALLEGIDRHDIVVRVEQLQDITRAAHDIRSSGKNLIDVVIEVDKPLSDIPIQEDWHGIPIALFTPAMGRFRDIAHQVPRIRDLRMHVYLPAENPENLTACHILSSLGITCCLVFGTTEPDWAALSDLMAYAVFGSIPHAPIEPFDYIARQYSPDAYTLWGSVYFDEPGEFLHLDGHGRVALSPAALLSGSFIADHIPPASEPLDTEDYRQGITAWRHLFLADHPCRACEGWRICMGRFGAQGRLAPGCSRFAADMLTEVEQYRTENKTQPLQEDLS